MDPDGRAAETIWDAANVVAGLVSAGSNALDGNFGAAAVDLGGVVVDGAATVVPFVPGGAAAGIKAARTAKKVHGNSKASKKAQHRYQISDQSGDVKKTGISGQKLNKDGSSPRANSQVNKLNKSGDGNNYSADVVETDIPGRGAALDAEKAATQKLREEGNSLRLQQRPK